MRRIAVLDAPSNLGLRPPTETSVPGCAKAPGALRDHGLLRRLNARDAGCLTPPRYDPGGWRPGHGVCQAREISAYSRRLADRIGAILDQGEFPVILGGDCSIVLGSALAMHRLGEAVGGRIGLVFVDGHSDFRHPGNASYVGAAAGEDLALVTGRGQADLASIEGRRPYYRDIDVVVMGIRAQDEYRLDLQAAGIVTRPVPALRAEGAARSAQWARDQLVDCAGYWVHVDVDVLDPAVMPAVDAPEPGGIAFPELELLLSGLVGSPHCLGVEITVFDPDYDLDGRYAEEITGTIVAGLKAAHAVDARPDLVEARRDLAGPGRLAPARPAVPPARPAVPPARPAVPPARPAVPPARPAVPPARPAVPPARPAVPPARPAVPPARPAVPAARPAVPAEEVPAARGVPVAVEEAVAEEPLPGVEPDAPDTEDPAVVVVDPDPDVDVDAEAGFDAGTDAGSVALPDDAGTDPEVFEDADEDDDADDDDDVVDVDAFVEPVPDDGDPADHLDPVAAGEPGVTDDPARDPDSERPGSMLRATTRPLGSAPLLDSKPLPATMPGMLRPRAAEDFTLPAQRPAFEVAPEQPADLA